MERPFNNTMRTYNVSDQTESNCGDITFLNSGIAPVTINSGLTLLSNQSFTFGANFGEVNKTIFRFTFQADPPLTQSLTVIRKFYI